MLGPRALRRPGAGQRLAHGVDRALDVLVARPPAAHGDAHDAPASPGRAAEPGDSACLDASDDVVGTAVVVAVGREEANEPLVDHGLGDDLGLRQGADLGDEGLRVPAAALHELGHPRAPERANGRVDREAPCPSRPLRVPVDRVAATVGVLEVARRRGQRGVVGGLIRNEGKAGVVGHVQPLVPVGRPGVGPLDAGHEVPVATARAGPEAEGSVHVHPCASRVRELAGLAERVERPGVQLAGLQADDGGSIRVRVERLLEQRQADPARVVGGKRDDRVGADAEQPDRAVERLVAELRGEHPQAGRAGKTVALNVDTAVVEQALPGRREAGHVRHLAAGHESKRGRGRQPEELLQP